MQLALGFLLVLAGAAIAHPPPIQDLKPEILVNGTIVTDGHYNATFNQTIDLSCKVTQESSVTGSGVLFRWFKWDRVRQRWSYWSTEPVDKCNKTDQVKDVLYCNMTTSATLDTPKYKCTTEGSSRLQYNGKSKVHVDVV